MHPRADRRTHRTLFLLGVAAALAVAGCTSSGAGDPGPPSAGGGPPPPVTGVPAGVALTPSSTMTVDSPGTVLDSLLVHGTITVSAKNVQISRSRIVCSSGDFFAVVVEPGASLTITDSELTGDCSSGALEGQDFVVRGVDIHGVTSDGIKIDGGNVLIENSALRDFAPAADAHADAIQASVPIGNVTIRNNVIDPGRAANGAIFFVPQLENGSLPGPVLLQGNTFGGGGDTVHIGSAQAGRLGDVRVIGNVWRRNSSFGPVYRTGYRVDQWSGNTYEDGTPVDPP